jgi:hypothetical protein
LWSDDFEKFEIINQRSSIPDSIKLRSRHRDQSPQASAPGHHPSTIRTIFNGGSYFPLAAGFFVIFEKVTELRGLA